jgi:hypothetical protein
LSAHGLKVPDEIIRDAAGGDGTTAQAWLTRLHTLQQADSAQQAAVQEAAEQINHQSGGTGVAEILGSGLAVFVGIASFVGAVGLAAGDEKACTSVLNVRRGYQRIMKRYLKAQDPHTAKDHLCNVSVFLNRAGGGQHTPGVAILKERRPGTRRGSLADTGDNWL